MLTMEGSLRNDHDMTTPLPSDPEMALDTVPAHDNDVSGSNHHNESNLTTPHTSPGSNSLLAQAKFDPFSYPVLSDLCSIWFQKYHPWFPILHQPSLTASLQNLEGLETLNQYLLVKAICAVTLFHYESPLVGADELKQWSENLRNEVYSQSLAQINLQSVQALLIISNIEFGEGRFEQFWNLIALCKRFASLLSMD